MFLVCFPLSNTWSCLIPAQPVSHCGALELSIGTLCGLTAASSSFLFMRRVQAIFKSHQMVVHAFTVLWIINATLSLVFGIISVTPVDKVTPAGYCVGVGVKHYAAVAIFAILAFDSLVFFVTSYGIAHSQSADEGGSLLAKIASTSALPRLSRAVLQGGQQYYL